METGSFGDNLKTATKSKKSESAHTFFQLVQQNQEMIYNVCFRLIGNRQDAEDIAQDVFVRAHQNLAQFQGESEISTWLYRIAVNLSLNFIKRRKRLRWLTLDFEDKAQTALPIKEPEADERPDFQFDNQELGQVLQQAIQKLPEKQRTAFVLHKLEGLSHQKISEILEISISSVEARIHRAKQTLKKELIGMVKN